MTGRSPELQALVTGLIEALQAIRDAAKPTTDATAPAAPSTEPTPAPRPTEEGFQP